MEQHYVIVTLGAVQNNVLFTYINWTETAVRDATNSSVNNSIDVQN